MADIPMVSRMSERQQLASGITALVLATMCILALPVLRTDGMAVGAIVGLLSVSFFVFGTLWVGTSEQLQV